MNVIKVIKKISKFQIKSIRHLFIFFVDKISPYLPTTFCLRLQFLTRMGKWLNVNNPKSFSEKLQWLKLYNRNPLYTALVDKYEVKFFVANKIGQNFIIPTIGLWNDVDKIDWDYLPQRFVLKTTQGGGSAGVLICKDKHTFDIQNACSVLSTSLKQNIYSIFREWPYKNINPRIIAEEYMEQEDGSPLVDYKFFCFNGRPEFLYVRQLGDTKYLNFVTMDWTKADFHRSDCKPADNLPPKPVVFEEMKEIAKKLSQDIPFVRVDLYVINNKIYFSELTFFPSSGLLPFEPQSWDEKLGDLLQLPDLKK